MRGKTKACLVLMSGSLNKIVRVFKELQVARQVHLGVFLSLLPALQGWLGLVRRQAFLMGVWAPLAQHLLLHLLQLAPMHHLLVRLPLRRRL